ncbi:MAG: glycosyltransferase [Butyrivibrio sp.]|nr:glycosyltransferase [Butyrivibrio sp.]
MAKRITISEIIYLAYFLVMLGAKAIGLYEGQTWYNICLVIGAGLFALKILFTNHSGLEYAVMALLLSLGAVVYLSSGEKSLLIFITMMLGMKNVSSDRVFKSGAVLWVMAFISMYVLAVIGVIPEIAYTMSRSGWPPILRHALGYPHPNSLHTTYFILTVFVLYSCRNLSKKYVTLISVILALGNCYVFMYSLSRNGLTMTMTYIFIVIVFTWKRSLTKLDNILIKAVFPFSALIMLVLSVFLKGKMFEKLNTILAGRLFFTRHFLTYEPLKLFGIREIPVPWEAVVIDSSYVYLIFRLGIIAFVLYFVAMVALVHELAKNDRRAELAVVLALSIGGINETYLFNQSFKNLIFVFLGSYLYLGLSRIADKHENIFTRQTLGLRFGNKAILLKSKTPHYNKRVPVNIMVFTAALFIVAGLLTSIIYVCAFPKVQDAYLPKEEIFAGQGDEVYLTQEEVNELKKAGNIIRGYVDENTPLYRMQRKSVAKVEYIRYIFSYGLWGGSIVALVFLSFFISKSKVRFFLRNKNIGQDYKENILVVHNYYRIPGGEDIVVANEKTLLEKNGHKVILYSRNNSEAGDHNFFQKIGLAFVSVFNIRTYREICELVEKEKIDVIHVHNTVALISPAVYLAGINMGIPVVQTIHNFRLVCPNGVCYIRGHVCERCLEHGLKASLLYNCYRDSKLQTFVCAMTIKIQRMLQTYRALYYICLTEFNKEKLLSAKQIKEENIYIKPNFTTMEAKVVPYSDRKKQFVYAGRIEKIKGMELLLQAWMKLGEKAPKLIICGSGELEDWCREYIQNNEITTIEMLGQIDNSEVKRIVGESLAMIYPTQWYEGFPMAVAEAYTMGTPIIASDIGNVGNLVVDNVTGIKFKSNSVVALAKAVEKFSNDPKGIPEEYLTKYTADNNYKLLKQIYEDIRRNNL